MRLRWNILLIAAGVFLISMGIIGVLTYSIHVGGEGNDFVIGALIGLLGTSMTALTSLGNNILEKDNAPTSGSSGSR